MSVGTRTRTLLKTTTPARRLDVAASFEALTQARAAIGEDPAQAELLSDSPNHLWSLPATRVLAMVHPDLDEAWGVIKGALFLKQHRIPVIPPWYHDVRAGTEGRAVTFWPDPGKPSTDTSLSAWVTALTHRIDPAAAPWLREHDPFTGLLDGLGDAPLDDAARRFLRQHTAQLREEWDDLDWPTPNAVVLGEHGMVPVHDDGVHVGLLLRRPLMHGRREWDLVAARWYSELLIGPREDHRTYADTYLSYERDDQAVDYPYIGTWSGYQVVRDTVALTAVMATVRRAHLDHRIRQAAVHRVACLRGAYPAPWNWGAAMTASRTNAHPLAKVHEPRVLRCGHHIVEELTELEALLLGYLAADLNAIEIALAVNAMPDRRGSE
ncbi:hypothetical protein [Kitasatospora sp. NPDC005856]|uniref:hypothetical protein n=1 Tax=Kitasatospora sp. NPDC005856 TaxID=3154566 RepID=UPI0033DD507B